MFLWHEVFDLIKPLRSGCARWATFVWLVIAIAGFCTAPDLMGVTSFIRSAYLKEKTYSRLIYFFNGKGICLPNLTTCWIHIVSQRFKPVIVASKYVLFVADGINVPKEGRRMPAVKSLHNASENNSKPEFIMGHSFQAIAMVCRVGATGAIAVPLISRISEGLTVSNRCTKTLLDKFVSLFNDDVAPTLKMPKLLVADAYYATGKVITGLLRSGTQLISRVKSNCVAYKEHPKSKKPKRGRPAKYGAKVRLTEYFETKIQFSSLPSPVYGEDKVLLKVYEACLLWRPAGSLVKFVWVIHPVRGRIILMSTDLALSALDIITVYGLRFKIEVAFKVALRSIGVYCYRFWTKMMTPIKRRSKGQWLHREPAEYREKMLQKLNAYHVFVQVGCIAQGALQFLCIHHGPQVWQSFQGFLRTMRRGLPPSERVAALALQSSLSGFFTVGAKTSQLTKILCPKLALERLPGLHLVA